MIQGYILVSALAIIGALIGFESATGHGAMHNPTRSAFMADAGLPVEYAGRLNPLPASKENLEAGALLYEENCAICHGANGDGRGEAAADLEPPPAALDNMYAGPMVGMAANGSMAPSGGDTHLMHGMEYHHPGLTHAEAMGGMNIDAYMFWAVSDGGEAFGSSMPAFKDSLTEVQRWRILLYVANAMGQEATP